jgi:cbb3-type cytochrome oxidase maturation protein
VSLGFLIGLSLALGVAAWLFFMWTVRSGQYEDPEGPKYRMLDDDEGEQGPQQRGRPPEASAREGPPREREAGGSGGPAPGEDRRSDSPPDGGESSV